MGKGSRPRPQTVSREELDLRNLYAEGRISLAVFNRRYSRLKRAGLIRRSLRILK